MRPTMSTLPSENIESIDTQRRKALFATIAGAAAFTATKLVHASERMATFKSAPLPATMAGHEAVPMKVSYLSRNIGNVEVFYREAGPADAPVILLLHGFPTSSHMFRNLIPLLAQDYRVIAPDLPGFGNTKAPPRGTFEYTFDNLARVIDEFTISLGLKRYAIYAFDYGAPTGYRL